MAAGKCTYAPKWKEVEQAMRKAREFLTECTRVLQEFYEFCGD